MLALVKAKVIFASVINSSQATLKMPQNILLDIATIPIPSNIILFNPFMYFCDSGPKHPRSKGYKRYML
jgi:hypothetical protein